MQRRRVAQRGERLLFESRLPTQVLNDSEDRSMITLLLVDDYRDMRALVRHYIERTPDIRIVGEAEDRVVAVALASALHPDVILMDIQMPR